MMDLQGWLLSGSQTWMKIIWIFRSHSSLPVSVTKNVSRNSFLRPSTENLERRLSYAETWFISPFIKECEFALKINSFGYVKLLFMFETRCFDYGLFCGSAIPTISLGCHRGHVDTKWLRCCLLLTPQVFSLPLPSKKKLSTDARHLLDSWVLLSSFRFPKSRVGVKVSPSLAVNDGDTRWWLFVDFGWLLITLSEPRLYSLSFIKKAGETFKYAKDKTKARDDESNKFCRIFMNEIAKAAGCGERVEREFFSFFSLTDLSPWMTS